MPTDYENSTQKTGSIAGKECPCATEEMLKIKKQYQQIVNRGRTVGANWAAKMLEHWMQGSGKDMIIKMEVLRRFSEITKAEEIIKNGILDGNSIKNILENIKDGDSMVQYLSWEESLTGSIMSELFYASGTSTLVGRIKLEAKRNNKIIHMSGTLEYHWNDPYDWHPGLTAYIPGIGTVEDADAAKYENAGCAKKFGMYSFWYQSFSYTYEIDDILWFIDTKNISWGKVTEGRPPVSVRGSYLDWYINNEDSLLNANGEDYVGLDSDNKNNPVSNPPQRGDRRERTREDNRRNERRNR